MDQGSNCRCDFREVQRFRKAWLWVLLLSTALFVVIVFGYGMLKQLVLGEPWGRRPLSDTALAIVGPLAVLLVVGLNYFFYALKLVIEVRRDGLYIHFFPLGRQKIPFDDIGNYKVVTYNPLKDYGGWGIRYGRGGRAYNVSGNRGVYLELSNGKSLLIGSLQPEELARAIGRQMRDDRRLKERDLVTATKRK